MGNESSRRQKWIIDQPSSSNGSCNHQNVTKKKYVSPQRRIEDAFRVLHEDENRGDLETKSLPTPEQYMEFEHNEAKKKMYGPPVEKEYDLWESGILPYNSKFVTIKEQKKQKEAVIAKKQLEEKERLEEEEIVRLLLLSKD